MIERPAEKRAFLLHLITHATMKLIVFHKGAGLMPTLQDLITDIDARLPNTFSTAAKVGWMQDKLNEIWPHVAFLDSYEFNTVAGQYVYVLPSYIKIQYIENIYISEDIELELDSDTIWHKYCYQRPNENISGRKYYDMAGSLGIYPVPDTSNLVVSCIFKKKPDPLDPDALTAPLDFDDELCQIFKYDVMRIISESPPYESANRAMYYQNKVDEIFDLILERELRYKVKRGNLAKPNRWWRW